MSSDSFLNLYSLMDLAGYTLNKIIEKLEEIFDILFEEKLK